MTGSNALRHVDVIMDEIKRAKQELHAAREKLLAERAQLDEQLGALDQELSMLEQLDGSRTDEGGRGRSHAEPLSRRVLDVLQQHNHELTFREMREHLNLDRRESRNLGPVLNQLAKLGKIASMGRGTPWRLATPQVA